MKQQDTLIGLLVAFCMSAIINLPLWHGIAVHGEWHAPDIVTESSDETFYLARIREVADGYPWLGHPFLWEQREARYPLGNLGEVILGTAMRWTGIRIAHLSILADAILPALLAFFLWKALRTVLPDWRWRLLLLSIVFLGTNLPWWKRPISPQTTTLLPFAYLWALFSAQRDTLRMTAIRSMLIGLMLYSYPYHWTYCLAAEGTLTLHTCIRDPSFTARLRRLAVVALPLGLIALPWVQLTLSVRHLAIYTELLQRLGLIVRHFPTALHLQIGVFIAALCVWRTRTLHPQDRRIKETLLLLLLAGIIALNQVLLTGKEAEFSSHYAPMVLLSVWMGLTWCAARWTQSHPQIRTGLFLLFAAFIVVQTARVQVAQFASYTQHRQDTALRTERWTAIEILRTLPDQQVILTDDEIGRTLTLYTSHYPFFVFETHMYMVEEETLWTRAAVQQQLFPKHTLPLRALIGTSLMNQQLYRRTLCYLRLPQTARYCTELEPHESVHRWEQLGKVPKQPEEILRILEDAHVHYALMKQLPDWLRSAGSVTRTGDYELLRFDWTPDDM